MSSTEPSPQHISALRKYFGHSTFRSMQWEIIHAVLEVRLHMSSYLYLAGLLYLLNYF